MEKQMEKAGGLESGFVRLLGEAGFTRDDGIVGELDLLASSDLPVSAGVVLTAEAHREFMESTGLLESIRSAARKPEDLRWLARKARLMHGAARMGDRLNRALCSALMELSATSVAVISEEMRRGGLRSIPEVRDAVQEAWLSLEGLERQIRMVSRCGEPPIWPVLVQRELHPEYAGWAVIRDPAWLPDDALGEKEVVIHDLEPAGEDAPPDQRSIARLSLDAERVLGEHIRLKWGLKDGRWHILATVGEKRNA